MPNPSKTGELSQDMSNLSNMSQLPQGKPNFSKIGKLPMIKPGPPKLSSLLLNKVNPAKINPFNTRFSVEKSWSPKLVKNQSAVWSAWVRPHQRVSFLNTNLPTRLFVSLSLSSFQFRRQIFSSFSPARVASKQTSILFTKYV